MCICHFLHIFGNDKKMLKKLINLNSYEKKKDVFEA